MTLLSWMNLPTFDFFQEAIEQWLSGISQADIKMSLDQLYIEQRLGVGPGLICMVQPHSY
jgi:hypothetical protein